MADSHLLTTREVAGRLGLSVRTVTRMAADGRLAPTHRIPGKSGALLFSEPEVEKARRARLAELEQLAEAVGGAA